MLTLEAQTDVAAPADAVWRVLTDYARYAKWTGAAVIAPDDERPGGLTYTLWVAIGAGPAHAWRLSGRETAQEPSRRIAWRFGALGVLNVRAAVDLVSRGGNTGVRHQLRVGGLVTALRPAMVRDIFRPVVERFVADLAAEARRPRRRRD